MMTLTFIVGLALGVMFLLSRHGRRVHPGRRGCHAGGDGHMTGIYYGGNSDPGCSDASAGDGGCGGGDGGGGGD